MKKILLPTDFSENAKNSIDYAFSLFGYDNIKYTLFNSFYATPPTYDYIGNYYDIIQKSSEEGLENELEVLKPKIKENNIEIDTISEYGTVAGVINKLEEKEEYDYIVMGTKGATGLAEVLIGSNALDVLKNCKTPLITIPENAIFTPPQKIVFASDQDSLANYKSLIPLTELAKNYNSEILVVSVLENVEDIGEKADEERINLDNYFHSVNHSFHVVQNEKVEEGIDKFIEEKKADMLCVIPKKHSLFDRIFHHSVSKKLVLHTHIPMITIHE